MVQINDKYICHLKHSDRSKQTKGLVVVDQVTERDNVPSTIVGLHSAELNDTNNMLHPSHITLAEQDSDLVRHPKKKPPG